MPVLQLSHFNTLSHIGFVVAGMLYLLSPVLLLVVCALLLIHISP